MFENNVPTLEYCGLAIDGNANSHLTLEIVKNVLGFYRLQLSEHLNTQAFFGIHIEIVIYYFPLALLQAVNETG